MNKTSRAEVSQIRQETQYTCVAASIASCLKAHGKPVTEQDVNHVLGASPLSGASWEQALATLQYFGMRGHLVVPATIDMLKSWTDAGTPVCIAWTPRDRPWAHASVVYDVDSEFVHVMDPNLPDPTETTIAVTHAEFYMKWFEKFSETVFVRRPALAVEREVTAEGRQVLARFARTGVHTMSNPLSLQRDYGLLPQDQALKVLKQAASGREPVWVVRDPGESSKLGDILHKTTVQDLCALCVGTTPATWKYERTAIYFEENEAQKDAEKRMTTKRTKKAQTLSTEDYATLLAGKESKFERGEDVPLEKLPEELQENVKNPPESVKQVTQDMKAKTASLLVSAADYATLLRVAVQKGSVKAEEVLHQALKMKLITRSEMTTPRMQNAAQSAANDWNESSDGSVFGQGDMDGVIENFVETAGIPYAMEGGHPVRVATEDEKEAKFEKGKSVPVSALPEEMQENVENPPPSVQKVKEELEKQAVLMAGSLTPRDLQESINHVERMMGSIRKDLSILKRGWELPGDPQKQITVELLEETLFAMVAAVNSQREYLKTLTVLGRTATGAPRATLTAADYAAAFEGDREAKFERGVSMTVDEVAAVVGPEFKDMNENPPESVVKVREEMVAGGKTAAADWVGWVDDKDGFMVRFFAPAPKAKVTSLVSEAQKGVGQGESQALDHALERTFHGRPLSDTWFSKLPAKEKAALKGVLEKAKGDKTAGANSWKVWTGPVNVKEVAKALKGVPGFRDVVEGTEHVLFKYNGDEADLAGEEVPAAAKPYLKGKGVQKQACGEDEDTMVEESPEDMAREAVKAGLRKAYSANLNDVVDFLLDSTFGDRRNPLEGAEDIEALTGDAEFAQNLADAWVDTGMYRRPDRWKAETLVAEMARDTGYHLRMASGGKAGANGLYGATRDTENCCNGGVKKLKTATSKIARALYAKDEESPAFLADHLKKTGARTARLLVAAMKEIGPGAALARTASGKNGLYGYKERTAKLSLQACTDLHHEAGVIASGLHSRRTAGYEKITTFLKEHSKTARCQYAAMLLEAYPTMAVTAPMKVASGMGAWLQEVENQQTETPSVREILATDFLASAEEPEAKEDPKDGDGVDKTAFSVGESRAKLVARAMGDILEPVEERAHDIYLPAVESLSRLLKTVPNFRPEDIATFRTVLRDAFVTKVKPKLANAIPGEIPVPAAMGGPALNKARSLTLLFRDLLTPGQPVDMDTMLGDLILLAKFVERMDPSEKASFRSALQKLFSQKVKPVL